MVKAILFDYGGVMTEGGRGGELVQKLGEVLQVDDAAATHLFESVWSRFTHGTISESALWEIIESATGLSVPQSKRAIWNTWPHMRPYPQMVGLIADLKKRGYMVGLLSNTVAVTSKAIQEHGGYDGFEPLILSYQVGLAKPEPEIYEYAENQLHGIKPEEILFIDDQERCLEPAKRRGWQTIMALSPEQITTDIEKIIS
ncbi:MAG: hypothetical protein JWM37_262 [Candidatus Saccharibacteria bacterium]|nr:hypothetical protein [Candidatus Saccharibacteria bacterium]